MDKDSILNMITDTTSSIGDKYDNHIKKRAIKKVDENLKLHNLTSEDIEPDDYEAMVSDAILEIKKDYTSNAAQVGFGLLGLDLLFGW